MKIFKLVVLWSLGFGLTCQAQIDTSRIEGLLSLDRKEFVHSLRPDLAIDDETTILRAHLLKLVICRITSDAAKLFCKDLKESEDLTGQNVELLDFALTSKNLKLVLEALAAIDRSAQSYALGKEAKEQIISLAPVLALAIARVGDPIKTANYVLKEIQSRSEVAKAFSDNVALRVYEPFLRDVLYWLAGKEPDGRAEPFEIAGSKVIEEAAYGCRVRKSGKFQCWKKSDGRRFDFPMETEEGFRLAILPRWNSRSATFCSQGPNEKLRCWTGSPTSDGGFEIEKCNGIMPLPPTPKNLYGLSAQWPAATHLVTLTCEKSGERVLAYSEEKNEGLFTAMDLVPNGEVDQNAAFGGGRYAAALFLNFACNVLKPNVRCQKISNLPETGLQLWTIDPATHEAKDAGTDDLFRGFGNSIANPDFVTEIHDGICVSDENFGFECRHFIIDGKKALAIDYSSLGKSFIQDDSDHFATLGTTAEIIPLIGEVWNFRKSKTSQGADRYDTLARKIDFDGGLAEVRKINYVAYFNEENILCYVTTRLKDDGTVDYQDPDAGTGVTRRCVRLGPKNEILSEVESQIPLNGKNAPIRIGRAMCIKNADQLVCDFPASASRLFEHPVLSLNSAVTFYDKVAGFLCSAEANAAVCYDLNQVGRPDQIKNIRFDYKAFSKEMVLLRSMRIRPMGPGQEPLMCNTFYQASYIPNNIRIYVCESAGQAAKTYRITETVDRDSDLNSSYANPAPRSRPARPKKKARYDDPNRAPVFKFRGQLYYFNGEPYKGPRLITN